MRICFYLSLLIIASIAGCSKSDQKQAEEQKTNQEALAIANTKIQELSSQIDQLRIENNQLKNSQLQSQTIGIQPRMQQLIACFGTGIWDYGDDPEFPVFVKAMKGAGVSEVVAELNERFRKYKQPTVNLKKKEGHTAFIAVDNEEQLDEQMGSSGATSYMTSVTYSLVSVKGIDCVYFDIGEGDHASPGKYCKDSLEPLLPK